ncbi:ribonuclease H-like domain-containing protein, partial [Tanacetum coccineum]
METQAIDDQDHLVNYDNDNENDDLEYRSEEYFNEGDKEDENSHSNGNVVKRGITRLYKFRREYGKPDGIKLSVTFDVLNRILGKHIALFLSFLGDMVREHIVRKLAKYSAILKAEEWVNFVKYTATEEYKVKSAAAKMARSKSVYQHTMGRGGYALLKEKMIEKNEIEPYEEPPHGTLWLKGRVNKHGEYPDAEIRSVGDKLVTYAFTVVDVMYYALWDVIENGNSFKLAAQTTTNVEGSSTTLILGPVTADEKTQKKNDVKARSMLLMALPNEHLLTFNQYKDAKTFAPSTESLDSIFNRLQKIISQLAILGENISQEDLNFKFLRSLPSEWNNHVVVWRNKLDLDTMSFDVLYNNFKIIKQEVKGTASSSSQNVAF